MSASSRLSINVARSRISNVEHCDGAVRIRTDDERHEYPGAFVMAGLVDAHAHILGHGLRLTVPSLYDCSGADHCCNILLSSSHRRGEWVYGMGWNEETWSESVMPDRHVLDRHFPHTPVYLRRADGHAAWVNSEALRRAGISSSTPDPEGGSVLRDHSGEARGILVDNAMLLIENILPPLSDDDVRGAIRASQQHCSARGLTEIHDMDVNPRIVAIVREMAERGELKTRVQTWVSGQNDEWLDAGVLPAVGEMQCTLGVKFFADGALGSRGAALFDDYSDDAGNKGLFLLSYDDLLRKSRLACEQGFHIATHAIGDAANAMVIDVYERLRKEGSASPSTILRIEHTQIIRPSDVRRMNELSITASVQPVHCVSDAPMAEKRLAQRCSYGYPWRSLLDAGVKMCAGSDFPIESNDPLMGIDAFCRRVPFASSQAWYPSERISRIEALNAYTEWAHDAADVSYRRGRIAAGHDADFVVLDRDMATCSDEELRQVRVIATYCSGRRTYVNDGVRS